MVVGVAPHQQPKLLNALDHTGVVAPGCQRELTVSSWQNGTAGEKVKHLKSAMTGLPPQIGTRAPGSRRWTSTQCAYSLPFDPYKLPFVGRATGTAALLLVEYCPCQSPVHFDVINVAVAAQGSRIIIILSYVLISHLTASTRLTRNHDCVM